VTQILKNYFTISLTQLQTGKLDLQDEKIKRLSVIIVPLIIAPISFLWAFIYYLSGETLAASIPLFYTAISIINLVHYHYTKNLLIMRKTQMLLILFLPFLLMWALGGFAQGSYVMIWAIFAPIGALIHSKEEKPEIWLYLFIILLIISVTIDPMLRASHSHPVPQMVQEFFFFLNTTITMSGLYMLLKLFIQQKKQENDSALKSKNQELMEYTKELHNNLSYLESYKKSIDKNLIVTRTTVDGKITFANQNFLDISGYTLDEILGSYHNIVKHPDNPSSLYKAMWRTILAKKTWQGKLKNRAKDGSTYWVDSTISPILDKDGNIVEFIAIRHNITTLLQQQEKLQKLLYTDTLTGLQNRNALYSELSKESFHSVILLNIDSFSEINNLYGEAFGDEILKKFTQMLKEIIKLNKMQCKLYRLAGDEFVILSRYVQKDIIQQNIERLMHYIDANPLCIQEQQITLNITAGVSFENNECLISTANMALKVARRDAKQLLFYSQELSLNKEYQNNLKWIKEIKDAIKDDRITLFYQPILDNKTNTVSKYETLMRLIDKDGKVITPYHFLEIAKKAKLYKQLTKIVLQKSFATFASNSYEFSINITIDDILDKDIKNYIFTIVEEHKSMASRVIFEIVESESIQNFQEIEQFIQKIKSFGCKIAIDDFGTGYSNFEHLMRLQADYIKIDGSIIKEIVHNKRSELITGVIVAFANKMGIKTIGEFVETKDIHKKLIELGVNQSQGYYFDQPHATLPKE
jgi:diguanylate cyclase (GGDEF)-like protein/PAS domain S-box-containing protein